MSAPRRDEFDAAQIAEQADLFEMMGRATGTLCQLELDTMNRTAAMLRQLEAQAAKSCATCRHWTLESPVSVALCEHGVISIKPRVNRMQPDAFSCSLWQTRTAAGSR